MRLLKCSDCNQEISITSDKCPYCGSQKQFKNYIFMRKELSKEGITPMEMMNFQRRGGKIKIIHWGKWFKYGGITFVLLFIVSAILGNQKVEYTKPDGTIVEITQFELNKINEAKRDKEKEKDLLLELKNKGISPDMVQIGNELNGGMVWPNGKTWVQGNEKIGGYEIFSNLLKAGIKATKETTPDAKIMIHLADGGDNELYRRVFDQITAKKVDFDIIGLSFYPYWHGTFDDLQGNLNDISKRYNKDVIVVEIAYAYKLKDGDGFSNIFGANEEITGGFIASIDSQSTVLRKLMSTLANVPNGKGKGFFYWEPDWIPTKGAGWKTGEGNGWDNQAMFDFNGKALDSLKVFMENPTIKLENSAIKSVNSLAITTYLNETPKLPSKIDVITEDGSISKADVKWEKYSTDFLKKTGSFNVIGAVSGTDLKAKVTITIDSLKNFVSDSSFESGDIWKNTKWILEDTKSSLQIEKNKANVHSENNSISYWKDSNFNFKIYQKIDGLENGTYKLSVWSMGEKGKKSLYLYSNNGSLENKTSVIDSGWSKWNKFEINNINVVNGSLEIGIYGNCMSGDWGKIDSFELIRIK